jgi:metal-responsive CopG/Arc/MetJ family transcriptional regulator
MRTTVNIDDRLLSEAKKQALESGSTLNRVIEDALRRTLSTNRKIEKNKVTLVTVRGSGLRHGVNLDDNQSLLDIMDE